MKNKVSEVVEYIKKEHGYNQHIEDYEYPYTYKTLLQKRVESNDVCECNDKLCINIEVNQIQIKDRVIESYKVEIVAEKIGKWWDLSCYSMNREEIMSDLKYVEDTLINLFNLIK